MIYLFNTHTNTIIGAFDSILLAKDHLQSIGINDFTDYIYLRRIEDMSYISRICYVDDVCIYNNKLFWLNQSNIISNDFELHTVVDAFGNSVDKFRFDLEMNHNSLRLNNIYNTSDEVTYNIQIGFEFIALFREECVNSDLLDQSGLSIAQSLGSVIPLIQTGSFMEAVMAISVVPRNAYLTDEKLTRYAEMLSSADSITYMA